MRTAPRVPAALAAVALIAVGGCRANHSEQAGPMAGDTIRGTVVITGADPITSVAVRTDTGQVALTGPAADSLRAVDGLEVWLDGEHQPDGSFAVRAFRVRAMDRLPATDGRLELDGDAAVLVTDAGERVQYGYAPPALRQLVGRRVWIAGRPGGQPQAWGVIGQRR